MVFTPSLDEDKRVVWSCSAELIEAAVLPQGCRG